MKIVIVTGMSGAGKTKAADWLEDQGYYLSLIHISEPTRH